MSKKCYYCNKSLPKGHLIEGKADASIVSACPAVNPRAMASWERGYNDVLDNKEEDLRMNFSYRDGYYRGQKELRKIIKSQ